MTSQKRCTGCKELRPLSDYNMDSHSGGPRSRCRVCEKAYRLKKKRAADPNYRTLEEIRANRERLRAERGNRTRMDTDAAHREKCRREYLEWKEVMDAFRWGERVWDVRR